MTKQIRIVEVGPRDGLQNEKRFIPTEDKIEFINRLSETGLGDIEITSFVSPKAIPQLADSEHVCQQIQRTSNINYWALVPNAIGLEKALANQISHIAVFTAASESFNQKNIKKSIAEAFEAFRPVVEQGKQNGLTIRGYVSTAFWCPYEGQIAKENVWPVIQKLFEMGITEISIGDTIGKATPEQVDEYLGYWLQELSKINIPKSNLAMHFHDTSHHALENIKVSLNHGITSFDASASGLGGCPYAPGASGNVATESVVTLLHELGYQTGIDLDKLTQAAQFIRNRLDSLPEPTPA